MINYARAVNLTLVPDCGVSCLAAGLYHTACALTDQACLCLDQQYNDWVTNCVTSNCTIRDQLLTQRATKTGCGVTATNDYNRFMIPEVIVFAFSTLFFALRMANRASRMAPWGWDDTTCTLSYILCLGFLGVGVAEVKLAAGKPLWAKEFWQIDGAIFVFWMSELLYTITLGLVKASILFLYTRIFSSSRTFNKIIWVTQLFNLLLVIGFCVGDTLQCRPLSYFWKSWDLEHEGTCFDIDAFAYAHSGINIALDVWMIILPAAQVWKLNMSIRAKLGVMTMFTVGIFLTIVTCIRLQSINGFYEDPTSIDTFFPIAIWTVVELNIGVVAACMPAARMYLAKTAGEIAKSTGWSKFTESGRPSYEESNPPSFIKRRSERFAAKHLSLADLGVSRFVNSVNRDLPGIEHQRHEDDSQVELAGFESKDTTAVEKA